MSRANPYPELTLDNKKKEVVMAPGDQLVELWDIPARQGRYREKGKSFLHLTDFPGAFIEPRGYLLFETETDLEKYVEAGWLKHYKNNRIVTWDRNTHRTGIFAIDGFVQVTPEQIKKAQDKGIIPR